LVRWEAEAKQLSDPVSNDNRIILHGDKTHYLPLADGEIGPVIAREDDVGLFMVYDWSTREVIWQHSWGAKVVAPFGFCFADGVLYLADLWGCGVLQVDLTEQPGRLLKRLSHPSMSDLHSVRRSKRGLLIACTGTDMILEIDTDGTVLYEWWAGDHGYTTSAAGVERLPQHGREHRDQHYHTAFTRRTSTMQSFVMPTSATCSPCSFTRDRSFRSTGAYRRSARQQRCWSTGCCVRTG
jgi:hypothetical protein